MVKEGSWADRKTNELIEQILEKGVVLGRAPKHRMQKWDGYKFTDGQLGTMKKFHVSLKACELKK